MAAPVSLAEETAAIRREIGRVVVGYEDTVDDLLLAALARGHVLLEGVPGIAKTTLAKAFATALGIGFRRIQFTQDVLPADITGHYYYNQQTREFEIRRGAIFADLLLADEVNRAPPKTQGALLEAMEERQATIEGTTLALPDDFMVIATMNPVEFEGVYRLPEAQLDRFVIRSVMGYLPREAERRMLDAKLASPAEARVAVKPGFLARARAETLRVRVDPSIVDYVHDVGVRTREHKDVALGASPRAIERLLHVARATAVLEGRSFVIPDDVRASVPRVLTHRLLLAPEAEIAGRRAQDVVRAILAEAPLPRVDL